MRLRAFGACEPSGGIFNTKTLRHKGTKLVQKHLLEKTLMGTSEKLTQPKQSVLCVFVPSCLSVKNAAGWQACAEGAQKTA